MISQRGHYAGRSGDMSLLKLYNYLTEGGGGGFLLSYPQ